MIKVQNRCKGVEGQMRCKGDADEAVQNRCRGGGAEVVVMQSRCRGGDADRVQRFGVIEQVQSNRRGAGAEVLQMCCRGAVGAELHEEVVQRCANVLMISR